MRLLRSQRIAAALASVLVLCASGAALAQTATAPELKAVFLYNFAKFTEWPADVLPKDAPLVLCVAGDARVRRALETVTSGRSVEGHKLSVRKVDDKEPLQGCHVLYADDLDVKRATELLERLKGAAVLSVSDFDRFTQLGGTAHLFEENGKMRFAVNLAASQRSRLRLSARLLGVAQLVKDDVNVSQR